MEYIYIIGIIGYYLYKSYSSNKEKEKEDIPNADSTEEAQKGFLDQMLEDLAQQQDVTTAKPKNSTSTTSTGDSFPPSKPVRSKSTAPHDDLYPPSRRPTIQQKTKAKEPVEKVVKKELLEMTMENISDLGVAVGEIGSEEERARSRSQSKRHFAGMNMSAKEAIKAKMILERKY